MTTHLTNDLESQLQATIHSGRFASVDEAVAEATRLFLKNLKPIQPPSPAASDADPVDPFLGSIGAMSDAADELDAIVADTYRRRREETWRDIDVE